MNSSSSYQPEFELTEGNVQSVRYLEHGFPNPLVRWHYHDDYELHYIVASTGKVFVGDYIGRFAPGNLVLTGPRLPHNWISQLKEDEEIALRDMAVQFGQNLVSNMSQSAPELNSLLPLLDRARYGIEFIDSSGLKAEMHMQKIRGSEGPLKISALLEFLQMLTLNSNYQLLSTVSMRSNADDATLAKIDVITKYVTENFQNAISLSLVAELASMSESAFSRFFTKSTGNGFSEFLNRVRISKACELLAQSDEPVTNICFGVGFNNVANFNRQFRKIKAVTPREYREQIRQRLVRGG